MISHMVKNRLATALTHIRLRQEDIDAPQRTVLHARIIQGKPFLRRLYTEWYANMRGVLPEQPSGGLVELGSGGGFCKDVIPDVFTTEILPIPGVDVLLDAKDLPFRNRSLKGIVMVDVFHHLPRVDRFLNEAARCIKPGGVVVMTEPWNTPWSRMVYRHLHHELFDADATKWEIPPGGPLSQANSALPWIVFERDRCRFINEHPQWRIKDIHLHTPFRYLMSGGISMRGSMPDRLYGFWRNVEERLVPFIRYLAMFATILLVRKDHQDAMPK